MSAKRSNYSVYVVTGEQSVADEGPAGEALHVGLPFKPKAVSPERIEEEFEKYMRLAGGMLDRAAVLTKNFVVDTVTLHLAVDADVGLSFVAHVGVEGAIDVTLKRV